MATVYFGDIPETFRFAASITDSNIVCDEHGVLRYEAKPIQRWLADHVDLNEMWIAYRRGAFTTAAFMQFYRDMGYSLGGFEEVWDEELDAMEADRAADETAS